MAVTYKDIDLLTQKATLEGTEKLPVSDTEFITPDQITEDLDVAINGKSIPEVDITPATQTGYWYQVSVTSISIQTASTSIYSGTVTAGSPPTGPTDGVDISSYIGRTIKCTVNAIGSTSNRATIIADANNTVLAYKRERDYVADGTKYSTTMVVPANAKYLYFSGSSSATGLSVKVLGEEIVGLTARVESLEEDVESLLAAI